MKDIVSETSSIFPSLKALTNDSLPPPQKKLDSLSFFKIF